jgi:hypothetical protein
LRKAPPPTSSLGHLCLFLGLSSFSQRCSPESTHRPSSLPFVILLSSFCSSLLLEMRSSAYSRLRGVRNDQGSTNSYINLADCLSLSLLERKKNADAFCPIQLIVFCSRSFSFRSPLEDISRCRTTYRYNVSTMWVMFRNDGVGSGLVMELV